MGVLCLTYYLHIYVMCVYTHVHTHMHICRPVVQLKVPLPHLLAVEEQLAAAHPAISSHLLHHFGVVVTAHKSSWLPPPNKIEEPHPVLRAQSPWLCL